MNKETKPAKWFKIITISYISVGVLFILIIAGIALFGGEPPVETSPVMERIIKMLAMPLLFFTFIGVPALVLVHLGLKNPRKPIRIIYFLCAIGWVVYMITHVIKEYWK
ncbi:MAG: hypothetical protein HY811_04650 [Planctomycetes bacterium]|nr:hypothetical protein [Planctomycetota bacterium]